jgi:hypothetical protein
MFTRPFHTSYRPRLNAAGNVENADATPSPFPESKEAIAGYWFIQADSLADAVEIAKGNPCLKYGETVEVRPILPEHSTLRMAQEQICPLNQK